jgi:hypothetical protein
MSKNLSGGEKPPKSPSGKNKKEKKGKAEKSAPIRKKILEALVIINDLGIPASKLSARRQEKMAMAFLAVSGVTTNWKAAKSLEDGHTLRSRDVIRFLNTNFEENIADSSYDDIRRKDLKLLTIAEYVIPAAGQDGAAKNDGTRKFGLLPEIKPILKHFGMPEYKNDIEKFMMGRKKLSESLERKRNSVRVSLKSPDGKEFKLSSGKHNDLQKAIVEEFLPVFAPGSELLYLGDTEDKDLIREDDRLKSLDFFELSHDELPDIIAYLADKNWLFIIEAVHSSGPISEIRLLELKRLTNKCNADIVYVTAFLNKETYRKYAHEIAWETEVWIAESPEHLIHFNGDKFLGPHIS